MLSIVGTITAYKIVHLLLIVDQNVRHVSSTSSAMVLLAIEQEWLTFQTIVVYWYEQKEEVALNGILSLGYKKEVRAIHEHINDSLTHFAKRAALPVTTRHVVGYAEISQEISKSNIYVVDLSDCE